MLARILLLGLVAAGLGGGLCLSQAGEPPAVAWSVERRDLPLSGWRMKIAEGAGGRLWVGGEGTLPELGGGGLLYVREGDAWSPRAVLPPETQRTYVLAGDSEGGIWLAPYHYEPDDAGSRSPYRGLRIRRFDGRRWQTERAPGLWPQVMAMVSPDEGWIAGNHGWLLHRTRGRWVRERVPGDPAGLAGRNFQALQMLSADEGWAAGSRGLLARRHGGRWRRVPLPPALADTSFTDLDVTREDGCLWLAANRGWIHRYCAGVWRSFRPTRFDLAGIDMISPQDGWAVGELGTILRYDGRVWNPQPAPMAEVNLRDVAMASEREGWIVGEQVVFRTHPSPPRFQDQSRWPGYPMARRPSTGVAVLDVDGDGDLDLATLEEQGRLVLGLQAGPRRFVERGGLPVTAGAVPETVNSWAWGDADGDGAADVALWGQPFGLRLLRQEGRGRFAVARAPAAPGFPSFLDRLSFLDLDRDGELDLYLSRGVEAPGRLFLRRGAGWLWQPDRRVLGGVWDQRIVWGDLDGDGDLDAVLFGMTHGWTALLQGAEGRFRRTSGAPGSAAQAKVDQGLLLDLDRDGDLDLLLLGRRLSAWSNDGAGRFTPAPERLPTLENIPGAPSLLAAGDLDHDGDPELLVETNVDYRTRLTLLAPDPASGSYRDVTAGSGLEGLDGEEAALADLDGDGDLDLVLARRAGTLVLENSQNDGSFLKVRLRGDRGNRGAVGAQVWLYQAGRRGAGALRGYRQMGVGGAVAGMSELHFGAPAGRRYDLEVAFPDGRRRVVKDLLPGRTVTIDESPPGVRQAWLAARWTRRTWRAADLRREAGKLAFVLLALGLWRGPLARRLHTRLFVHRRSVAAVLLAASLGVGAALAAERRVLPHVLHLAGFTGALGLLAGLDVRLSRWKNQRYLGPFFLEKVLGQGGMGVVYRARHVISGQTVALKAIHPRWLDREDLRLRFLREAQALTRLDHPGVVRVFETGAVGDRGYISMELLKGKPLSEHLRQEGPLAPEVVIELLYAACGALAHVHANGLVHGDVKSANLFLLDPEELATAVEQGWRPRIKLMDFGLARRIDGDVQPAGLDGTPAYLSPEQIQGRPLDARSDLYSVGVLACEALDGEAKASDGKIFRDLSRLLSRLRSFDPAERPGSAEEVRALLRSLRRQGGAGAPAGGPEPRAAVQDLPPPAPPSRKEEPWKALLGEAQAALAAGRLLEGQVRLVECLTALGEALAPLSEESRESYCRDHREVGAALALHRRLSPLKLGPPPP